MMQLTTTARADVRRALWRFYEAMSRQERARWRQRQERRLAVTVARAFIAQGEAIVSALSLLRGRFDQNAAPVRESISPSEWGRLMDDALAGTAADFADPLEEFIALSLAQGAGELIDELGVDIIFAQGSPEAIAYAQAQAARQVTRINATTRQRLNQLIADAVRDGTSWNDLALLISQEFADFAGAPLFPSAKYTSRAEMVAAYEIGDAYEAGSRLVAGWLRDAGWQVEKKWSNAGDGRVRQAHLENTAAGWIPLDDSFPSGHDRPPTDPGCRCTLLYRRTKE